MHGKHIIMQILLHILQEFSKDKVNNLWTWINIMQKGDKLFEWNIKLTGHRQTGYRQTSAAFYDTYVLKILNSKALIYSCYQIYLLRNIYHSSAILEAYSGCCLLTSRLCFNMLEIGKKTKSEKSFHPSTIAASQ